MSAASGRPLPKALVAIDPHNPYARARVSPLATTEVINAAITAERKRWFEVRQTPDHPEAAAAEDHIMELDALDKQIGTQRARDRYDSEHPATELLTVQPSRRDALDASRRARLASAWLQEELGPTVHLSTPTGIDWWSGPGWIGAEMETGIDGSGEDATTQAEGE